MRKGWGGGASSGSRSLSSSVLSSLRLRGTVPRRAEGPGTTSPARWVLKEEDFLSPGLWEGGPLQYAAKTDLYAGSRGLWFCWANPRQ